MLLLALGALACGLPTGGTGDTPAPDGIDVPPVGQDVMEGESDTSGDGSQAAADDRYMPVPGGVSITQTTPESGSGAHPTFAWEPVEGAARYMLYVFHADGGAYWAWEGDATQVMLGGFDAPPSDSADGPRLTEPMQWAVLAVDANDHFIASSPLRDVAP
jgi:hypothetical protein